MSRSLNRLLTPYRRIRGSAGPQIRASEHPLTIVRTIPIVPRPNSPRGALGKKLPQKRTSVNAVPWRNGIIFRIFGKN